MSNRNLSYLVPKTIDHDQHALATVTQVSQLRIRIDTESAPLPFTPMNTVAGLAVNDRVVVLMWANTVKERRSRRVIVQGKLQ
jgi:hypothetical protein